MKSRRILLILGLYGVMLLIAVGVVFYSDRWYRHRLIALQQPPLSAPVDEPLAIAELPPLPPLEQYAAVIERPLFMSTRRPPEPETAVVKAPEPPPPRLPVAPPVMTLRAVMMTPQRQIALATDPRGRPLRLQEGSIVEEWQVTTIEPQQVILQHGSHQHRVPLRVYEHGEKAIHSPAMPPPPGATDSPAPTPVPGISFGPTPDRS